MTFKLDLIGPRLMAGSALLGRLAMINLSQRDDFFVRFFKGMENTSDLYSAHGVANIFCN
jgi:hypothetical protein